MPKWFYVITLYGLIMGHANAHADEVIFKKEANLIGGYSDVNAFVGSKGQLLKNSIGFEYFRKFANEYGDYLTADLQMRLSYDSTEDSQDAWAIEIHNAWLDYKLGLGKTVRVGHFDPAFGLEPLLDTHGTLMQTLAHRNIGFKKDWGIGYRGLLGDYDLESAVQIGSGMGLRHYDNNILVTSRIGSQNKNGFQYGISALYGEVLQSRQTRTIPVADIVSENGVVKKRVGFDAQLESGAYLWKNEVVFGQENDADVLGAWSELDYTLPSVENVSLQLQAQYWVNDLDASDTDELTLGAGMEYAFNPEWKFRVGYFHDVNGYKNEKDQLVLLQFYFLGD